MMPTPRAAEHVASGAQFVRVQEDFVAQGPLELSVAVGEVVEFRFRDNGDGWTGVRRHNAETGDFTDGYIPTSYCNFLDAPVVDDGVTAGAAESSGALDRSPMTASLAVLGPRQRAVAAAAAAAAAAARATGDDDAYHRQLFGVGGEFYAQSCGDVGITELRELVAQQH
jgi:hypothetical protein